jgi:hypothetical protein
MVAWWLVCGRWTDRWAANDWVKSAGLVIPSCQERRTLDSPGLGHAARSLRPSSPVGLFLPTAGLGKREREVGDNLILD